MMLRRPLRRRPDWPERLAALIEERRDAPFAWGAQDCMTFAADAVRAMTDCDPIAEWRGAYATEAEGDAILGPDGLEAFVARLMAEHGAPAIVPSMAQRGDWVMARVGNMALSGVHLGAHVAVPGDTRLAFLPARRVIRAWSI